MTSRDLFDDDDLLAEQRRYYEDRAPVYDDLWFRRGHWATDDEDELAVWRAETASLEEWVRSLDLGKGSVLELACGSGLWTRWLAPHAARYVAVDASTNMLALNRERVADPTVDYRQVDLFSFNPGERFDVVFAGFWLSHVPPSRWRKHWADIRSWLAPGGFVAMVDDHPAPHRRASIEQAVRRGPAHAFRRELPDGRAYRIVKRFFSPEALQGALAEVGFAAEAETTGELFIHATARPADHRRHVL